MRIIISKNRRLKKEDDSNTQNENKVTELTLELPEEYENWNKRIVFITDDGVFWDYIQDNTYLIKKNVTRYESVQFYIWLTNGEQDFRSETKNLFFNKNEEAGNLIPTEEQIDGFNTLITTLNLEITRVNDKETELNGIITDLQHKLDTGYFNGTNGSDGEDGESAYQIWIEQGNQGTEQDFLNSLKGHDGTNGVNGTNGQDGFSPVATVQETATGATISITDKNGTTTVQITNGQDGTNGTNGQDGYTPVRGVDYWTDEDIAGIENHCDDYADEIIADLEEQVEDLQKNQLQGNESGTSIDLNDSADSRIKSITLWGNSIQKTIEESNLFDINNANYFNGYINTTSQKLQADNGYKAGYIQIEPNKTYFVEKQEGKTFRIATTTILPANDVAFNATVANHTGTSLSITTGENDNYLVFLCWSSANGDTMTANEMYNTVKVYTEREIKSVGDNGSIVEKFVNNNLLNCNTIEWYPIKSSDGSVNTGQQGCHSEFIKVNKNFNYILRNNGYFNGVYYYISRYDKQKNYLRTDASKWFSNVINIEPSSDTEYIIVSWLYISPNDAKVNLKTQLEQGTVATTFIQHQEQTYTIPCQQPMRSIENVKDTFIKVNGVWYERHNIARISSYNGEEITTAYMSTTGELSTGATVDYVLITPQDLTCTQAQITALEALSKARTYKNITHIYSEDEIPAEMDLTYYKDTETIINDLITRVEVLESEV